MPGPDEKKGSDKPDGTKSNKPAPGNYGPNVTPNAVAGREDNRSIWAKLFGWN